jgi:hypothetical protein
MKAMSTPLKERLFVLPVLVGSRKSKIMENFQHYKYGEKIGFYNTVNDVDFSCLHVFCYTATMSEEFVMLQKFSNDILTGSCNVNNARSRQYRVYCYLYSSNPANLRYLTLNMEVGDSLKKEEYNRIQPRYLAGVAFTPFPPPTVPTLPNTQPTIPAAQQPAQEDIPEFGQLTMKDKNASSPFLDFLFFIFSVPFSAKHKILGMLVIRSGQYMPTPTPTLSCHLRRL